MFYSGMYAVLSLLGHLILCYTIRLSVIKQLEYKSLLESQIGLSELYSLNA